MFYNTGKVGCKSIILDILKCKAYYNLETIFHCQEAVFVIPFKSDFHIKEKNERCGSR